MKSAKTTQIINFSLIFLSLALGLLLRSKLPLEIPTHFDANGVADKFSPRDSALVVLPFIALFSTLLITFLSKANKAFFAIRENEESVHETNLAITALFVVLYFGQILIALMPEQMKNFSFFALAFGAFFLLSVRPMKKMGRNMLLGIRVPWTMKSDEVWSATHQMAAKIMLPLGLVLVVAAPLTKSPLIIFGVIGVSFIVPMIYSYKLSKN